MMYHKSIKSILTGVVVALLTLQSSAIAGAFIPHKYSPCHYDPALAHMYMIMNRNADGIKKTPPCWHAHHWWDRYHLSGLANIDTAYGNRSINSTSPYDGSSRANVQINALDLYGDAALLPWIDLHAGMNYHTLDQTFPVPSTNQFLGTADGARRFNLEEGYATIGNLRVFPVYLRIGKQYLNYGDYTLHPMVQSLTQLLTQTNQIAATLGFVTHQGIYGAGYWFQGGPIINRYAQVYGRYRNNYGAQLGWAKINYDLGFNVNIGYLHNMTDVQYVQFKLTHVNGRSGFRKHVGGFNVGAAINSGPFTYRADYVTALNKFDPYDFVLKPYNVPKVGAKPWAFGVASDYAFKVWHRHAKFTVGYQRSGQAAALMLPRWRAYGGFSLDRILPNTNIAFLLMYDRDYNKSEGATGGNILIGYMRLNIAVA